MSSAQSCHSLCCSLLTSDVEYIIRVFTGDKSAAGTDAKVFITLFGTLADSGERNLKDSDNHNPFERSQVCRH